MRESEVMHLHLKSCDLPEHPHHHSMISLVWLQCKLLLRLQFVCLQFLDLSSKHLGRFSSRVYAVGLHTRERVYHTVRGHVSHTLMEMTK